VSPAGSAIDLECDIEGTRGLSLKSLGVSPAEDGVLLMGVRLAPAGPKNPLCSTRTEFLCSRCAGQDAKDREVIAGLDQRVKQMLVKQHDDMWPLSCHGKCALLVFPRLLHHCCVPLRDLEGH
jgi:hypothetical protein